MICIFKLESRFPYFTRLFYHFHNDNQVFGPNARVCVGKRRQIFFESDTSRADQTLKIAS